MKSMTLRQAVRKLQTLIGRDARYYKERDVSGPATHMRVAMVDYWSPPNCRVVLSGDGTFNLWRGVDEITTGSRFLAADDLIDAASEEELHRALLQEGVDASYEIDARSYDLWPR